MMMLWLALMMVLLAGCVAGGGDAIEEKLARGPQTEEEKRLFEEEEAFMRPFRELEQFHRDQEEGRIDKALQPDRILISIATGFASLSVCSAVFVSGIAEEVAVVEDATIAATVVDIFVDYGNQSVIARMKWWDQEEYKTIFLGPTLGCMLVGGGYTEEQIRAIDFGLQTPIPPRNVSEPWPLGEGNPTGFPPGVNEQCVRNVVDADFAESRYNTRSTVIVYNGQLIYERYADTVTKDSPLLSWSMAKSILSILYGIVRTQETYNIDDTVDVPEWQGDRRREITYNDMFHMTSGILWGEGLDLFTCLYHGNDCAAMYKRRPRIAIPSLRFNYATAASYMLAWILEKHLRNDRDINTFDWHREVFFRRMGMHNAVFEFVPDGYLAGGSLAYLTARDWARMGYLYQRRGDWFGDEIVHPGWVDHSCIADPNQEAAWFYGLHWWFHERQVDPQSCVAEGFRRQNVFVLPSRNVVVARNAMPHLGIAWTWDRTDYMNRLMACFP